MSTGLLFWLLQAVAVVSDRAERDRAVANGPAGLAGLVQAYRFADQGLADEDGLALPLDLAILTHPAHFLIVVVFRLAQNAVEAPRRGGVAVGRRGVAERFVRALFVEHVLKLLQALELLAQVPGRRVGGVLQQRQMHPFVPAVLLRLARF